MAGKRPRVKAGIKWPKKEDVAEGSAESPVEVIAMAVTPLREHPPPEGSTRREDARQETAPKKGVPSPSSIDILDGEENRLRLMLWRRLIRRPKRTSVNLRSVLCHYFAVTANYLT